MDNRTPFASGISGTSGTVDTQGISGTHGTIGTSGISGKVGSKGVAGSNEVTGSNDVARNEAEAGNFGKAGSNDLAGNEVRAAVSVRNLRFSYGKHVVFEDLTLDLKPGMIYGLLGENGVGKTTLLRIISGLLRAKSGTCTVNGINSASRNPLMLQELYYVPEIFFAPSISVNTFARSNSLLYPNWNMEQFQRLCATFEVDPKYRFDKLSHGQQKKALIAFSLSLNTKVLLMDEPSNGLDIPSKTTLRKVISECATEDRAIVISTHQVRDLENLIDPIIILDKKGMILCATIEQISEKLMFTVSASPNPEAYWSENNLNGYYEVVPNREGMPSRVNLEALFNATLKNKETFRNLFR